MAVLLTLLAQINERNREFWKAESARAGLRITDPDILRWATADVRREETRFLSVQYRKSFEQALQDAEASLDDPVLLKRTHRQLSRRGGASRKGDALQGVILDAVHKRPAMTARELLQHLQSLQGVRQVIDDIDEGTIYFKSRDGHSKQASVSGLKDRLWRAKRAVAASAMSADGKPSTPAT
jgi:hypothetical protein